MNALYCSKTWVYCVRQSIQGYFVWLHFSLSKFVKSFPRLRNPSEFISPCTRYAHDHDKYLSSDKNNSLLYNKDNFVSSYPGSRYLLNCSLFCLISFSKLKTCFQQLITFLVTR